MKRLFARLAHLFGQVLRKVVGLTVILVVALLVYLGIFAASGFSAEYPRAASGVQVPKGTLVGAYHVHSTASDGRGTPADIALAASRAGLAFVVLTDHNQEQPEPPHFDHGVLMIPGTEISTPVGHLVALGLPRPLTDVEKADGPAAHVEALGGIPILAHPVQNRMPWSDWRDAEHAAGLELYSGDTMLREAVASPVLRLLPAAGAYLASSEHGMESLVFEQPETTRKLLALSDPSPRAVLCGLDAHGFPSYEDEFKALAMQLPSSVRALPDDPQVAARVVIQALASRESLCVFRVFGDATGFSIDGLSTGREAGVGDLLKVVLPRNAPVETQVIASGVGKVMPDGRSVLLEHPGAAEIEVWRRAPGRFFGSEWKPWIVASPVRAKAR